MARSIKKNLDYFPLDCRLDDKFEIIEAMFGLEGFGVIIKILQRIYSLEGYYCDWSEEAQIIFAKNINKNNKFLYQVVNEAVKRGMFDMKIYERYKVLTSRGVQKRYIEASSRRSRVEIKKEYLLLDEEDITSNVIIIFENGEKRRINGNKNEQKKEKEKKEEKIKKENAFLYKSTVNDYNKFCPSLPRCKVISEERKKAMEYLFNKGISSDDLKETFQKAEASPFLKGINESGWRANFDWIIKYENYIKVCENRYNVSSSKKNNRDEGYLFDEEIGKRILFG